MLVAPYFLCYGLLKVGILLPGTVNLPYDAHTAEEPVVELAAVLDVYAALKKAQIWAPNLTSLTSELSQSQVQLLRAASPKSYRDQIDRAGLPLTLVGVLRIFIGDEDGNGKLDISTLALLNGGL